MRRHILAVLVLALACSPTDHVVSSAAVRDSLAAAHGRGESEVSAVQIAPGTWRELFIFSPYTPPEVIRRCAGGGRSVDDHGLASRDDIDLLVFRFADGQTVSRAVPRGAPDFGAAVWNARYGRTARFRVASGDATTSSLVPLSGRIGPCK
jgi:hypothetical protein